MDEEPSALEFMRYVARNRPFVVRDGARDFPARRKWCLEYLVKEMGDAPVKVAITPRGNADSVVQEGGELIFVKPYEAEEPFGEVIEYIQKQEKNLLPNDFPVRYAQTQNDNLRGEYSRLFADVPASVPFARIALQRPPDAINFWLGNSRSATALHKDNYENLFVQLLGQKHFTLLPPVEAACVNEKSLPTGTYEPSGGQLEAPVAGNLAVRMDFPPARVPFAAWDPDVPSIRPTTFSHLSRPLKVTLGEGDVLYLPALWYHKVSQSCSEEGVSCGVNYWYDMDFSGSFWPLCAFARSAGLAEFNVDDKAVQEES